MTVQFGSMPQPVITGDRLLSCLLMGDPGILPVAGRQVVYASSSREEASTVASLVTWTSVSWNGYALDLTMALPGSVSGLKRG
jgi:hypothetical protein